MVDIPRIKKRLSSFIKGEEGKISKKSVLRLSMIVAASTGVILNSNDSSARWIYKPEDNQEFIRHSSHSSHSSY